MQIMNKKKAQNDRFAYRQEIQRFVNNQDDTRDLMRKRRKKFEMQRRLGYEQGKQEQFQRSPLPTMNRNLKISSSLVSGRASGNQYQIQPHLKKLVKIGFPNLKISHVGTKWKGSFREKPSVERITEKRKKITTRNNHLYIYSRLSDSHSYQDLAGLSSRSRARVYLDNQSYQKLRKGKLNHTTNTYGCDSHLGSKSQDKDAVSLTSRPGRIKSTNIARIASRG